MATRIADNVAADAAPTWTIESARALYNIEGWGAGFFDISEHGWVGASGLPEPATADAAR